MHGMHEVVGSIPISSTSRRPPTTTVGGLLRWRPPVEIGHKVLVYPDIR